MSSGARCRAYISINIYYNEVSEIGSVFPLHLGKIGKQDAQKVPETE